MAKRGICIGINDYDETDSTLSGCINDAQDWAGVLSARGFSVVQLLDSEATKQEICSALESAIDLAQSGDSIVITFSGHGSWQPDNEGDEPDGRDEGWCPFDIKSNGLLVDDELYSIFGNAEIGVRLVMLSDSCHSGSMTRLPASSMRDGGLDRIRFMPPSRFLDTSNAATADLIRRVGPQIRTKPDRALLMSGCLDDEFSYDSSFGNRPNGAFTYYAIKSLKSLPRDASYRQWLSEIRKFLPNASHPQTPDMLGSLSQRLWKILD